MIQIRLMINWTPRNLRWSAEERERRKMLAQKLRAESSILWAEKREMLAKIHEEILQKRLARIHSLD